MRVDTNTLEALRGSHEKWLAIRDGHGVDLASKNCPLCELFVDRYDEIGHRAGYGGCHGCPIAAITSQTACQGTPYSAWLSHRNRHGPIPWRVECPECRTIAGETADFIGAILAKAEATR